MAKKETIVEKMDLAAALAIAIEKPSEAQVTEAMKDKAFEALVLDVAARFGKAGSKARKPEDWGGLVEKDEFKLLPYAPRSGLVGESPWPKIAGHSTYPMTPCLRREEADAVYKWRKAHEGTGTPTGSRAKTVPISEQAKSIKDLTYFLDDIREIENKGMKEVAERMEKLAPALNAPLFVEIFNGASMNVLKGCKVSLAYLLCRKGEERPNPSATMGDAMQEGFFPAVSKADLDSKLEEFKAAGIDCSAFIELK